MDKNIYGENRQKLAVHLSEGDTLLLFSGESVRKTADENYPFFANRNFLYLTGVRQEQSVLLMQNQGGTITERLFVLKPDADREIWTGRRFRAAELSEISGIERIEDAQDFDQMKDTLLSAKAQGGLWLCFDALRPECSFDLEREFARKVCRRHPHVVIRNCYPLLAAMRKIKSPEEVQAIRSGMEITGAGIHRLMRAAKPGITEAELEAEFMSELAAHGRRHSAFPSIIAAGQRIFYLHYAQLDGRALDGDLILADVGAAYDEYCTDISRVFPANGRFSKRQAQIYRVAYAANRAIMAQVRPGAPFSMTNRVCHEVCFEGLQALGLLDEIADIGKYVWHRTTHHVGLDTHDVGGYDDPMAENMVFTVDAGIYVREWGIGLRIEDNVLVTADGCENLSASIPATIEAIEYLMAQH